MSKVEISCPMVVVTYRVRIGEELAFERLLKKHTPVLRGLGLITNRPVHVLRQTVAGGNPLYVEVFEWASVDAAERASEVPDVITIWEPMASLCEARDGHAGLEFSSFNRVELEG